MAQLYFKVQSDYDKVIRLREEIKRLKDELNNVDTSSSMNGFNALNSKLQATTKEYNNLTDTAIRNGSEIERSGISLSKVLGLIGGTAAIKGLISQMINVRGEFQAADTAIETLLGNKQKADELMSKVRDYAKISPLEFSDVTQATQMMLGFNIAAEKVPRFISALGDVSMGNSQKFNSLTLAFSQMSASGKLMGQDLNQMINAGFNPLSIMAEKTGVSISKLKDEMGKGKISAQMVQQAFIDATSAGGKFYQMSENASKTIQGQISMFHDAVDAAFNDLGKKSESVIINGVQGVTELVQNYETVGKVLMEIAAVYGTYKAAVIAVTALQALQATGIGAMTTVEAIHYGWLVATEKAQKALNAAMLTNPYVLLATAVAALGVAMYNVYSSLDNTDGKAKELKATIDGLKQATNSNNQEISKYLPIAQDAKKSTEDRKKAIDKLKSIYPSYFKNLSMETASHYNVANAIAASNGQLRNKLVLMAKNARAEYNEAKTNYDKNHPKGGQLSASFGGTTGYSQGSMEAQETSNLKSLKKAADEADKSVKDFDKQLRKKTVTPVQKTYVSPSKNNVGGGSTGTVKDNANVITAANDKINELEKKSAEERIKQSTELEDKASQAKIDAMADGYLKEKAQRELNHRKELEEFDKQKQEDLKKRTDDAKSVFDAQENKKAKENSKYKKKTFDSSSVNFSDDENGDYSSIRSDIVKKQNKEDAEAEKAHLEELLSSHQDYTQKKELIDEKYNKYFKELAAEREEAEKAGDTKKVSEIDRSKMQAQRDYVAETAKNSLSALKDDPTYLSAFEDLKSVSDETLNSLIKKFEEAKDAQKDLQPTELKEYMDTIEKMRDELDNRNPFKALKDSTEEYKQALTELEQAKKENDFAQENGQVQVGSTKTLKKDDKGNVSIVETPVYNDAAQAAEKYAKALDKVQKAGNKVEKSQKKLTEQFSEMFRQIQGVGDAMGGEMGKMVSLIGDIGSLVTQTIDAVQTVAVAGANALSTVEKASVILTVISAALQVFNKISSAFGANYDKYEAAKDEYKSYMDVLDDVIAKQKELVETLDAKNAANSYDYAQSLIDKSEKAARTLGKERLNAGASAGSHAIGTRQRKGMNNEGWSELNQWASESGINSGTLSSITGGRMEGLFDLTSKQLEDLKEKAPTFWAKLDGDVKEYLQDIIDCNDKEEELKDTLNESLTQVSFDSVYDDFMDTLDDMDASSSDFANNFTKYLQNAMIKSMIADKYKEKLKEWYQAFSDAEKDGNVSGDELSSLKQQYNDIVNSALKERNDLASSMGWSSDSNESQTATSNSIQSITADQADQLVGRITAMQIAVEAGNASRDVHTSQITLINTNLGSIGMNVANTVAIIDDTRSLIANSLIELQSIDSHQKKIEETVLKIYDATTRIGTNINNKF